MKIIFALTIIFGLQASGHSQNSLYIVLCEQAFKLYESKSYLESARKYEEAFSTKRSQPKADDRYNAACSWSLANQIDSSFYHLFYIANYDNYSNIKHLQKDSDLDFLHDDAHWNSLFELVLNNHEKADALLDKKLISALDSIRTQDQKYRSNMRLVEESYGRKSPQMDALAKQIILNDSINLIQVKKILDERGWLGANIVGWQGNQTLFLVIQHADLGTQKKYLPMMRVAVKKEQANAGNFAMLQDRVAMRTGKKQIYGSQMGREKDSGKYYVLPLRCPKKVNKRRAKMGLSSIEDYISFYNIDWNAKEHRARSRQKS